MFKYAFQKTLRIGFIYNLTIIDQMSSRHYSRKRVLKRL